jgi:hypothetical protein
MLAEAPLAGGADDEEAGAERDGVLEPETLEVAERVPLETVMLPPPGTGMVTLPDGDGRGTTAVMLDPDGTGTTAVTLVLDPEALAAELATELTELSLPRCMSVDDLVIGWDQTYWQCWRQC